MAYTVWLNFAEEIMCEQGLQNNKGQLGLVRLVARFYAQDFA